MKALAVAPVAFKYIAASFGSIPSGNLGAAAAFLAVFFGTAFFFGGWIGFFTAPPPLPQPPTGAFTLARAAAPRGVRASASFSSNSAIRGDGGGGALPMYGVWCMVYGEYSVW
jgi:hypothetical protein